MEELQKRHVEGVWTLDWNLLDRMDARHHVNPYLTLKFCDEDGNVLFSCNAWRTALNLRETIYKELVVEFTASYKFDEDVAKENRNVPCIKYRLVGVGNNNP